MHSTTGHYRFLSCRDAALFPWHALLLWPQNQLWKHRELCLPHVILFRARYCFHQESRRSGHEVSQGRARFVAGLGTKCRRAGHDSSQVWARCVTGPGTIRRRSAFFGRTATQIGHRGQIPPQVSHFLQTRDTSPCHQRRITPEPATFRPQTCDDASNQR